MDTNLALKKSAAAAITHRLHEGVPNAGLGCDVLAQWIDGAILELDKANAEKQRLAAELAAALELLAEIEFRIKFNSPIEDMRETAQQIDEHLLRVGHRK